MADSIIQSAPVCYVTGSTYGLDQHHVFKSGRRKLSEKYGLKVWLRHDVHMKLHDHSKPYDTLENDLKEVAQRAFEDKIGTREDFMKIFGSNYLDLD